MTEYSRDIADTSRQTRAPRRFDAFRHEYSTVRPQKPRGDETPATVYTRSPRPYPSQLPPLEYPAHWEVRLVSVNDGLRWQHRWVNVSYVLAGEYVAFTRSTTGSGSSTLGLCAWAGSTSGSAESKTPSAGWLEGT